MFVNVCAQGAPCRSRNKRVSQLKVRRECEARSGTPDSPEFLRLMNLLNFLYSMRWMMYLKYMHNFSHLQNFLCLTCVCIVAAKMRARARWWPPSQGRLRYLVCAYSTHVAQPAIQFSEKNMKNEIVKNHREIMRVSKWLPRGNRDNFLML